MDNASVIKLIFILQATLFSAMIGVYIWSFKLSQTTDVKISKVYDTMNKHIQEASIHQDDTAFVRTEVFDVVHKQLSDDVTEIKSDVKVLSGDIREVLKKVG